jgi:hypothetical protein
VLPQQKTANAEASLEHDLAPGQTGKLSLVADNIRTSNGQGQGVDYTALGLRLGWGRTLVRGATLFLQGGVVGGLHERQGGDGAMGPPGRSTIFHPTAAANLSLPLVRSRGLEVSLGWGAGLSPQVTSLSGEVQQRVEGATTLSVRILERTTAAATCDVVQTLPIDDPREARLVGAGLNVAHKVAELVDLNAGYRSAWQHSRDPSVGSLPRQWFAYLGVSLRAPPLKF